MEDNHHAQTHNWPKPQDSGWPEHVKSLVVQSTEDNRAPYEFQVQQAVGWVQRSHHPMAPWDTASLWSALGTFFTAITCGSIVLRAYTLVCPHRTPQQCLSVVSISCLVPPRPIFTTLHLSLAPHKYHDLALSTTVAHLRTLSLCLLYQPVCLSLFLQATAGHYGCAS